MSTLIFDSFAWVEFLGGTANEAKIRELLTHAEVIATPDLVLAEVARKLAKEGVHPPALRRKVEEMSTLSEIVPISIEIALGVFQADIDLRARAKERHLERPGLADAVILATARAMDGQLMTGDPHFRGFHETLWVGG